MKTDLEKSLQLSRRIIEFRAKNPKVLEHASKFLLDSMYLAAQVARRDLDGLKSLAGLDLAKVLITTAWSAKTFDCSLPIARAMPGFRQFCDALDKMAMSAMLRVDSNGDIIRAFWQNERDTFEKKQTSTYAVFLVMIADAIQHLYLSTNKPQVLDALVSEIETYIRGNMLRLARCLMRDEEGLGLIVCMDPLVDTAYCPYLIDLMAEARFLEETADER